MAVSFTGQYTVLGNLRCVIGKATVTTITSGAVAIPGINRLIGAVACPVSAATAGFSLDINAASGGTATDGYIRIKSASTGGVYSVIAFGN